MGCVYLIELGYLSFGSSWGGGPPTVAPLLGSRYVKLRLVKLIEAAPTWSVEYL